MRIIAALLVSFLPLLLAAEPETVLTLAPGDGNPRNSEGDFIRLEDGRVLFVYTRFSGGGSDHDTAMLASRVSRDGGKTWSGEDEVVVPNEGEWNVMSVSLLRLADRRIALFYLQKNSLTDCRPVVRFSSNEAETWSEPVAMIPDKDTGYYVMNNDRVIQLSGGRLVAPVALHNRPGWEKPDWAGEIHCYLSDDGGATWRRSATSRQTIQPDGRRVMTQEPGVVELKDGRLLLWVRTNKGEQYRSYSGDGGDTWSDFEPMGVASPQSPATIERLPSTGDLLLVWNDHSGIPAGERKVRTPFHAAVSSDDGETWSHSKPLAVDPDGWYCYTAMDFVDGDVLLGHVAGSQKSGSALSTSAITRFPEKWLYD